jgi:hypothetical protein
MLEPKSPNSDARPARLNLSRAHHSRTQAAEARGDAVPSSSSNTRRSRSHSRPTVLVVHSRFSPVRFRILSIHAPSLTEVPLPFPAVSLLQGHRTCQKAMECNGDETSHWYQR